VIKSSDFLTAALPKPESQPVRSSTADSSVLDFVGLGQPDEIGRAFAGFQKYLYQEAAA
jgi:hypothetical protein